jgi:hypothetical protein
MDIGRSFTFVTEDEDWLRKVLIGGLISLIPIVGQLYMAGYAIQVIKNTIEGREVPLPEATEDFGIGSALLGGAFADTQAQDTAGTLMALWGTCFGCVTFVLSLATSLLLPFAWSKYAESGQFGDAFKLGELFNMLKANLGPAIIAVLVSAAAAIAAGIVGTILCGIGFFFTGFYAQLITAFLYGSVYREAKAKAL